MTGYQLETVAPWIIPLFGALAFSGGFVEYLAREVLREGRHVPRWLEVVAPLKGRWLGLLLATPLLVLVFLVGLGGVYLPLTLLAHHSWPLGLLASLGMVGLCWLLRSDYPTRPGR